MILKLSTFAVTVPSGMTSAYRNLEEARPLLYSIFQGKDSLLILRRIRDWNAQEIEGTLRAAFDEANPIRCAGKLFSRGADCTGAMVA